LIILRDAPCSDSVFLPCTPQPPNGRNDLSAQPIDATQVLNLSAGVSNAKVFRGRSFS
jgi:hypothetical protein